MANSVGLVGMTVLIAVFREKISQILHMWAVAIDWITLTTWANSNWPGWPG